MNKRVAPRIPTSMAVAFSSTEDFLCGTISNISSSGVFIRTETVLPVDTELALRIRLSPDLNTMDIAGRVVWAKQDSCASPAGMGIEFVKISSADMQRIEHFIREQARALSQPAREKDFAEAPFERTPARYESTAR